MVTGSFSFHYLFEESQVEFGVGHTYMILVVLPELLWVNDLVRSLLTEDADERHRTLRADSWSQSPLVC